MNRSINYNNFTIISIGDPTTMVKYDYRENNFVARTEKILNQQLGQKVDYYNLGVDGYNIHQISEVAELEASRLKPNLVVYAICVNDFVSKEDNDKQLQKNAKDREDRDSKLAIFRWAKSAGKKLRQSLENKKKINYSNGDAYYTRAAKNKKPAKVYEDFLQHLKRIKTIANGRLVLILIPPRQIVQKGIFAEFFESELLTDLTERGYDVLNFFPAMRNEYKKINFPSI